MSKTQSLRELSPSQSHNVLISSDALLHSDTVLLIAFMMSLVVELASSYVVQIVSSDARH
jgi:hypothetical protein